MAGSIRLFSRSLSRLTDFVVAVPGIHIRRDEGLFPAESHQVNPLLLASEPFLTLLHRLDEVSYGPTGLDMPRWALFDCGELPGVVTGYGMEASHTGASLRRLLNVPPGYQGLVPLSMAILIPHLTRTVPPDSWFAYSLCSANEVAPGAGPAQLKALTLAATLSRLGIRRLWAIHQWRSPNMEIFSRLGPLRLTSGFTPAHSDWKTAIFWVDTPPESLEALLGADAAQGGRLWGEPGGWLDADEDAGLIFLQGLVEAGHPCWVAGPPQTLGDRVRVPIRVEQASDPQPPFGLGKPLPVAKEFFPDAGQKEEP
ncbi:MAG: hypothetical protein OEW12_02265 [Deltaproteobacteria bacterium]|nr:hypothetical protein [Deltaproteobacteria bacterium]